MHHATLRTDNRNMTHETYQALNARLAAEARAFRQAQIDERSAWLKAHAQRKALARVMRRKSTWLPMLDDLIESATVVTDEDLQPILDTVQEDAAVLRPIALRHLATAGLTVPVE
jgi:hypothetical protein